MAQVPDSYLLRWRDLTILVTEVVGNLLGMTLTSKEDILTVNGFAMRIVNECTAIDYVVILATAMLLYTRHSISYRLLGLILAVPMILLANACRLLMSGVVGSISRSAFDFVHEYLWVIGFALIVFAIWSLWVNGRFVITRSHARRAALVALVSLATYALLTLFRDSYGDLLARMSSFFYTLLHDDPGSAIVREAGGMVYSHGGTKLYLNNLLAQINVAVYAGLMIPLQKKGDWEMLAMTAAGLVAIVIMSAVFIALGCMHAVTSGATGLLCFIHIGSLVHLALPMAIYWTMVGERERELLALSQAPAVPSGSPQPRVNKGKRR